jgi:hypothetical protein
MIMFPRRRVKRLGGWWRRRRSVGTTSVVAIYVGISGALYLISSFAMTVGLLNRDVTMFKQNTLVLALGFLTGTAWLYGARLIWRKQKRGLIWITIPLLLMSIQWFASTPNLSEFVTWDLLLLGVVVTWWQLVRDEKRAAGPV